MSDDQVQPFITQCAEFPPNDDSGLAATAESSPCTQGAQQGEIESRVAIGNHRLLVNEHDDKSTSIVITGKALLCPGIWDAVGKRRIVDCHQEDCVCNERSAAAHTETTPAVNDEEELPAVNDEEELPAVNDEEELPAVNDEEELPAVKEKEELPIQCSDKCHRGELVLPHRYRLA